jgi:prepilin-type N-terminal cleavage/methylation domain-containing protein
VKYRYQKLAENKGFSLPEVMIAMSLFIIVLTISSQAFNNITKQASKFSKMEETSIVGAIGLEVMRHDLEQMGFGLPWGWISRDITQDPPLVASGLKYDESSDAVGLTLNDAPNNVPRAFAGFATTPAFANIAYFSIKGTTAGRTKASQRWTYIPFHNFSAASRQSRPISFASNNPDATPPYDKVIIINSSPDDPTLDRQLVVGPGNSNTAVTSPSFAIDFRNDGNISDNFLPTSNRYKYMVYGLLDNKNQSVARTPRMPFNRADYFVSSTNVPAYCAPGTGVLYKGIVNHNSSTGGGDYDAISLLDCVADMQVVLGWDMSTSVPQLGSVTAYSSLPASVNDTSVTASTTDGSDAATAATIIKGWLSDPKGLREHLKTVKIYILAQEGKRDLGYTAATPIEVGNLAVDGFRKSHDLTDAQKQYRWKVYQVVARPRNLYSNSY